MLSTILYELTLFSAGEDQSEGETDLSWALQFLTTRDQNYLKQRPETPSLYECYRRGLIKYIRPAQAFGECDEVRVLREALGRRASDARVAAVLDQVQKVFGGERFRDIGRIIENGGTDCDGLGSWRAAELRQKGVAASPYMTCRREGGGLIYHVIVRWPDGSSEDPSLICGMGGADRAADRQIEIDKNKERCAMIERAKANGWRPKSRIARNDLDVIVERALAGRDFGKRDELFDASIDDAISDLRRAA